MLPSIKNSWLQVLSVASLEVALATSSPDVMKLLRPDQLCQGHRIYRYLSPDQVLDPFGLSG